MIACMTSSASLPGMAKPNFIEVKFVYDSYVLDLQEESVGTQKLFKMICPLMDVLSKGKILLYDELERSLHPASGDDGRRAFERS